MASRTSAITALCFVVAGCTSATQEPEPFSPLERAQSRTVEGDREALHDLSDAGSRFGQVKLWSRGALTARTETAVQTMIHVAFEVENSGNVGLTLDPQAVRLESVQTATEGKHVVCHHTRQSAPESHADAALRCAHVLHARWRDAKRAA